MSSEIKEDDKRRLWYVNPLKRLLFWLSPNVCMEKWYFILPRNTILTTDIYGLINRNDELISAVNDKEKLLKEKAEK